MTEILLASEIAFGRLDGCVSKQELNLFNLPAIAVAELRTSPPQVVGRNMQQACFFAAALDHVPHHVLGNAFAPDFSCPCYSSKDLASGYTSRRYPEVERRFRPIRNGHGSDVATLTD